MTSSLLRFLFPPRKRGSLQRALQADEDFESWALWQPPEVLERLQETAVLGGEDEVFFRTSRVWRNEALVLMLIQMGYLFCFFQVCRVAGWRRVLGSLELENNLTKLSENVFFATRKQVALFENSTKNRAKRSRPGILGLRWGHQERPGVQRSEKCGVSQLWSKAGGWLFGCFYKLSLTILRPFRRFLNCFGAS